MLAIPEPAAMVIMFWKLLIIHQNFLYPRINQSVIIVNENST